MNIRELIERKAEENKNKIFLCFKDHKISYKEMNEKTNMVANGLLKLGIKRGTKIAVMMPNCPEWLYSWFGIAKIGAVMVPVNVALKGQGLEYILDHSDSQAIIIDERLLGHFDALKNYLRKIKNVIVHREGKHFRNDARAHATGNENSFEELFKFSALNPPDIQIKGSDVMSLMYTSGTTGPPKGCMRPHVFPCYLGRLAIHHMKYEKEDILYTCLPLFHGNAQDMSVMPALLANASLALDEKFSASRFWRRIKNYNATAFNLIGAMTTILYKQPASSLDKAHRATRCFVAGMPKELWMDFEKRFGVKVIEGYGLVENGIVLSNSYNDAKVGSIGKPTEIAEVKIFNDEDEELPPYEVGEIVTRPKKPSSIMLGYWKMPKESLKSFRNLWFHTGDYGYTDEKGFFYFVDRKKDAIRRRGENISSWEIEKIINEHPKVLECVAIPVPSGLGEDDVKVCVVRVEDDLSPEDLIRWCEERMAYFMVPRYVEFKEELPKTPTQRVRKHILKAEGITSSTWDREKAGYKIKKPF